MNTSRIRKIPSIRRVCILAATGSLLMVMASLIPAHWRSVAPSVVRLAGQGTPTVTELGLKLIEETKPGPAGLILDTAQRLDDPRREQLAAALAGLQAKRPELMARGGQDQRVDAVWHQPEAVHPPSNVPALEAFLPERTRRVVLEHLHLSRSPGVRAILQTREVANPARFVAVHRPGGQPFEATILLAGVLYEGEYLPAALLQEMKALAEAATERGMVGGWENLCMDLLSLGARLNWTQLTELLHDVPDVGTLAGLARAAKTSPESLSIQYTACLMTRSPAKVVSYLDRYGGEGLAYIQEALKHGQGAVQLLVRKQLPVSPRGLDAMAFAAPLVLQAPWLALGIKAACFILAVGCFYLVWSGLSVVERVEGLSILSPMLRLRRAGVAMMLVFLLMALSEPFLTSGADLSGGPKLLNLPVLSNAPAPRIEPPNEDPSTRHMLMNLDLSTILSVALFAALQIVVYAVCLLKIHEIHKQPASPQLKLKLMENEENLFDAGLYVGIAGTAAALILQVLHIIEANLLAAYSSNLFGILCVAIVKIRHVRSYKRELILQSKETIRVPETFARTQPAV